MVTNSIKTLKTVHIKKKQLYFLVYDALLDMERCLQCSFEREMQSTICFCINVYIYISMNIYIYRYTSDQIRSVAQLCPTLCDPLTRSTPGLPVHHKLPEFTQTHVHRVNDAIQPSHPLSSPSPLASNPSQHQSLSQ